MDRLPTDLSDDVDLDALMIRVREAAMATGTRGGAARPHTDEDAKGADSDLVRDIDAQGDWNEHTRTFILPAFGSLSGAIAWKLTVR